MVPSAYTTQEACAALVRPACPQCGVTTKEWELGMLLWFIQKPVDLVKKKILE